MGLRSGSDTSANGSAAGGAAARAPRVATRSWARVAALAAAVTAGAMVVGGVVGAAIAAPNEVLGELLALSRWAGAQLSATAAPLLSGSWSALANGASAAGLATVSFVRAPHSLREISMLVAGGLTVLFALAAAVRGWQAAGRRRSARTPFAGIGLARGGLSLAGVAPARRSAPRTTPKEVRAQVERGSTLTDIARRTGLPVDALAMLLDASEPNRQVQP